MNIIKVIIVDPSQFTYRRRKGMKNAFKNLGLIYEIDDEKQIKLEPPTDLFLEKNIDLNANDIEKVEIFDLALIHYRDIDLAVKIKARHRIWYGGISGIDNVAPVGEDHIYRAIDRDGKSYLSQKEAQEIIKYIKLKMETKNSPVSKPASLCPATFNDTNERILTILHKCTSPENIEKEYTFIIEQLEDFPGGAKPYRPFLEKLKHCKDRLDLLFQEQLYRLKKQLLKHRHLVK